MNLRYRNLRKRRFGGCKYGAALGASDLHRWRLTSRRAAKPPERRLAGWADRVDSVELPGGGRREVDTRVVTGSACDARNRARLAPSQVLLGVLAVVCAGAWLATTAGAPGAQAVATKASASASNSGQPVALSMAASATPPGPVRPATFVPLEMRGFPGPTAGSCADNRRVIQVPSTAARTITAALARATPGTVVRVAAGRYRENPSSWFALEMSTANVCLVSVGGPAVVTAAPGQNYGLLLTASDTVVRGLTLNGFRAGISLGASAGATQRRVSIEDVVVRGRTQGWSEGIVAYPDHRELRGRPPVVDGLLLRRVQVLDTVLGISCNAGPCVHWWLDGVRVVGRGGSEDSGADAFAVEEGRQIVLVGSTFARVSADGIDTKAADVVVLRCLVRDVGRNAIKLWRGGDVIDSAIDGSGADAALVGDAAGRYRYFRLSLTRHAPGGNGYVGTWGYDAQDPIRLEIIGSRFGGNSSGGLYVPAVPGTSVALSNNLFADRGTKLLDWGGRRLFMTTPEGVAGLQAAGFGWGNRLR